MYKIFIRLANTNVDDTYWYTDNNAVSALRYTPYARYDGWANIQHGGEKSSERIDMHIVYRIIPLTTSEVVDDDVYVDWIYKVPASSADWQIDSELSKIIESLVTRLATEDRFINLVLLPSLLSVLVRTTCVSVAKLSANDVEKGGKSESRIPVRRYIPENVVERR